MKELKTLNWVSESQSWKHKELVDEDHRVHERRVSVPGANTPMCRTPLLLQSSSPCCASAIPAYQKPAEITQYDIAIKYRITIKTLVPPCLKKR